MMDGLVFKEVTLKDAKTLTDYFRLEAEYYNSISIETKNIYKGLDVVEYIQYGTSKRCDEGDGGIPVLRLNELNNGFISTPQKSCHILSDEEYESLRLKKGDVLIIRTNGNPNLVGKAAVVLDDTQFAFASYLFRVITNKNISPELLMTFLNCKYGRMEIDRNSIKGNQTNFSPAKFRDIIIPRFGEKFRRSINDIVLKAYNDRCSAKRSYLEAEMTISNNLKIQKIIQLSPVISTKMLSDSFLSTGRLDAEYYQPKYDLIVSSLNTKETLESICNLYDENYLPDEEKYYRYIELANVGGYGEITDTGSIVGEELPTRARRIVKSGQVIV